MLLCLSGRAQPGSLDATFGVGAKVLTDIDQTPNVTNSVLVQPDGKIIVVGYCSPIDYTGYFAIARYKMVRLIQTLDLTDLLPQVLMMMRTSHSLPFCNPTERSLQPVTLGLELPMTLQWSDITRTGQKI